MNICAKDYKYELQKLVKEKADENIRHAKQMKFIQDSYKYLMNNRENCNKFAKSFPNVPKYTKSKKDYGRKKSSRRSKKKSKRRSSSKQKSKKRRSKKSNTRRRTVR